MAACRITSTDVQVSNGTNSIKFKFNKTNQESVKLCLNCWSDVQKFPLRMKDNDLLVTELYRDPTEDAITALSVYLTPKTSRHFDCSSSQQHE